MLFIDKCRSFVGDQFQKLGQTLPHFDLISVISICSSQDVFGKNWITIAWYCRKRNYSRANKYSTLSSFNSYIFKDKFSVSYKAKLQTTCYRSFLLQAASQHKKEQYFSDIAGHRYLLKVTNFFTCVMKCRTFVIEHFAAGREHCGRKSY